MIDDGIGDIEVQIRGLMLDPVTNMPIVVLKDLASDLVLPIWVGVFEANAIALELEKTAMPRPMTHDLLRNMARGLNAVVDRVVVSDLREDTFYATIWMTQGGEPVVMDARPSDAIALALRWGLSDLCGEVRAGSHAAELRPDRCQRERGTAAQVARESQRRRYRSVQDVALGSRPLSPL